MAGQDFAHIEAPSSRDDKASSSSAKGILTAVLVMILLLAAFLGGYWIGRDVGVKHEAGDEVKALQAEIVQLQEQLQQSGLALDEALKQKQQRQEQAKRAEVGELTFYADLPNQQVEPHDIEQTPSVSQIDNTAQQDEQQIQQIFAQEMASGVSTSYQLQMASFASEYDAKQLVSRLAKHGVAASIVAAQVKGVGQRYRVYSETMSKSDAKTLQQQLIQSMKLKTLLMKKR